MENKEVKVIPGFREDQMTGYKPGRVYIPMYNRWIDDPVSRRTDIVPNNTEVVSLSLSQQLRVGLITREDLMDVYKDKNFSDLVDEDREMIEKLFSETNNEEEGGVEK